MQNFDEKNALNDQINFFFKSSFTPLNVKLFVYYLKYEIRAQILYKINLSNSSRSYKREKIEG